MFTLRGLAWGPPPLPEVLTGQLHARGFAPGDARLVVQKMKHDDVDMAGLFLDLGSCKFLEADIDGAIAAWRHSIASDDDAAASQALLNLGLLYEHLHLHGQAVPVFAAVGERDETHAAAAAMARARCQQALGEIDAAMETMARLAQTAMANEATDSELAEVLYGFGEVAYLAGRHDRAHRAWKVASAGPPSAPQKAAAENLIGLLIADEDDDALVEVVQRQQAGFLNGQAGAILDRATLMHRRGDQARARDIAAAVAGAELTAEDRFSLAELRIEVGLVNEAIDELEELLSDQSAQTMQRAAFSLGEVYRTYDMVDAATSMYEVAAQSDDAYWAPRAAAALTALAAERADVALGDPVEELSAEMIEPDEAQLIALGLPVPKSPPASEPEPISVLEPEPDPVVVRLSSIDDDSAGQDVDLTAEAEAEPAAEQPLVVDLRSMPNPYAVLAPDKKVTDVRPSPRNPYAELAPNFDTDEPGQGESGRPSAWESLSEALGDDGPSAFSRYM